VALINIRPGRKSFAYRLPITVGDTFQIVPIDTDSPGRSRAGMKILMDLEARGRVLA